jgi:hypothetical protein
MKLLVSGAREGFNQRRLDEVLGGYLAEHGDALVIIEGCAPGVDTQAFEWAKRNRVPVLHYPAPWTHLGKPAGRWRNRAMLRILQPDHVVAFHADIYGTSRGTRDMVEIATESGIPTHLISTP